MAKKLIKNYVFTPGVGLDNNLYPNAHSLVTQNKSFIINEIVSFVGNSVDDATKCERDIGYILDGVQYDIALGTNYNAIFLGLAEYNSLEVSGTVIRTIQAARDAVGALPAVSGNATALARSNTAFNEIVDIASNGRANADALSYTNPTGATASQIAAKNRLINNRTFFAAEVNAWVDVNYPAHDHDEAKCERDVKYAIDAITYDILYGGTSATYDSARFFYYGFADGSPGIDPTHKDQTYQAYLRLRTIVGQVVRGETVTRSAGNTVEQYTLGSNADAGDATTLESLVGYIANVINTGTGALPVRVAPSVAWADSGLQAAQSAIAAAKSSIIASVVGFKDYSYNEQKCVRDTTYVIDALIHDLRYGGNEKIHYVASKYWNGNIPQIDGTRYAEYETYRYAIELINDFILTNTEDPYPEQDIELQVIDNSKTAEAGAFTQVETLLNIIVNVIQNGLSSLPAKNIQLGRVEILGKYGLEDLLLISNVTTNDVIYNFADSDRGGMTVFDPGNSDSFPQATSVSNGVTVINFKVNTSAMSSTDSVQIFIENSELKTRPYDFGTDAIERMRVAQPQAMIDADFEYGLQPTKWQAIGMQRGYPSTYEVSATDIAVTSVVTDASTGTGGVGSSLITVTTNGPHGLSVGQAITIRALAAAITGFARAEGTFLIYSVPSTTTFTYYAKSKVGTTNGQILATSTTQLRQAAFYTGASVGQPTFSVASNGASGSFTTALQSPSGSNTLTFVGAAPPVGAPLSGTGINPGTQVSGVFGPSNSDGLVDYRYVKTTSIPGATSVDLVRVDELQAGMALADSGSVVEITSIVANTLNLNAPLTIGYGGDENLYAGSVQPVISTGTGCRVDVAVVSDVYSVTGIAAGGSGYQIGDTIRVAGEDLGGTAGINDLWLNVQTIGGGGAVTAVDIVQGAGTGTATYTNVATSVGSPRGIGMIVQIQRAGGSYSLVGISGGMTYYYVGNRFKIPGDEFEGATPANDCTLTVTSVSGGAVTGLSVSGTATRGDVIPVYATITISENTTAIVPLSTTITYTAIATLQVQFTSAHGFVPGMSLNIAITSTGTNHQLASGPFSVEQVINSTTIRYVARAAGSIDTGVSLEGVVYVRPDAFFTHRPFDGGVMLGTGGPQHGGQAIRQSKKYIRYQSGKGAMYNTGALFAPSFDLRSITASGTQSGAIITVVTDDVDHGLQSGAVIRISGVETTGYDGEYTVSEIIDERTFRVLSTTQLASTTGTIGSQCQMALVRWHGAVVRSGPFDDQNGIFFQYDGQQLAVGRRTSTFQIAGTVAIGLNSNAVTGTNTRFLDQLQEGDRIVIRGMTHVVTSISSQTQMTVNPDWRGVNAISGVKVAKIQDLIIPQSEWNLDKCDGTGPSGYDIDITKMQMIGIQFSWYGAGFIDWMFRGPEGNYVFCHRLKGNNLNTEAYMRTGNLPVRYEVLNEGARTRLTSSMGAGDNFMNVDDISMFPDSGVVYIDTELISYSGKLALAGPGDEGRLTGLTRAASLTNFAAGAVRTYTAGPASTHNADQGVVLVSNTTSPIISHWGSAYLIDGNFDEDRGYIFSYASTGNSIDTTKKTVFLIRLAPSVSNAVTGDLGERELLNRAQLLLKSITITSDNQTTGASGIVVEGVLNPQNYPLNPADILWGGLTALSQGGQPSFAQIAPGGSVNWNGGAISTTSTATTTAKMNNNISVPNNGAFARPSNTNVFYILQSSWQSSGATVGTNYTALQPGLFIDDVKFPAGTTINSVQGPYSYAGFGYYVITTSRNSTSAVNANATITLGIGGNSATNTSQLFFTQASWTSSNAIVNTEVSDSAFPANTRVASVTGPLTFGATTYYRVTFTQSSVSSITAGGTVTFRFGVPPYALPGETVFSFVANPGSTETLELGELKELTTTAIGGRGTFPNGPDVLAINVYKVGGTATTANLILRWGEAQA